MPISIHPDSHTDHNIPELVLGYVLTLFDDRTEFFVETVTYPERAESVHGEESLWATDPETAKHLGIAILFYLIGSFGRYRCPKKRE